MRHHVASCDLWRSPLGSGGRTYRRRRAARDCPSCFALSRTPQGCDGDGFGERVDAFALAKRTGTNLTREETLCSGRRKGTLLWFRFPELLQLFRGILRALAPALIKAFKWSAACCTAPRPRSFHSSAFSNAVGGSFLPFRRPRASRPQPRRIPGIRRYGKENHARRKPLRWPVGGRRVRRPDTVVLRQRTCRIAHPRVRRREWCLRPVQALRQMTRRR